MHAAKSQLSRLVQRAAKGETILIAKAGRPLAQLVPLDTEAVPRRLGFLAGQGRVPEDFDRMDETTVAGLFEGG